MFNKNLLVKKLISRCIAARTLLRCLPFTVCNRWFLMAYRLKPIETCNRMEGVCGSKWDWRREMLPVEKFFQCGNQMAQLNHYILNLPK